ncbi:MAG: ABC transporter substrate-binding protein [Thaumarchaeota archaeon S15]|nr:MAG: ABC transporter substrate-binding protein [Thaumarchaeota archaeon S13]RNJ74358.1 MAG: ABC transporter substrate-binding protein [Thaumarchaeota archaeon S15]
MSVTRPAIVGAVCLAAGLAIGVWAAGLSPVGQGEGVPRDGSPSGLSGTVDIGMLMPLTGGQSTHGEENAAAAVIAVDDLNDYLSGVGAPWRARAVMEDTGTSPALALEKLTTLSARGITAVVGPQTSGEVRAAKAYADSNGMILFSHASTAPALAIPGDSVYRMLVDDTKQGPVIASLADRAGASVVVPVWRADTWGEGLSESASEAFRARGGTVDEGIPYNPETVDFSATVSVLAEKVEGHIADVGTEGVIVLLIAFNEALPIMQTAANHGILADVRWLGTDGNALVHKITEDPIASAFADSVEFTTVQISATRNPIYEDVRERVGAQFGGREPNAYAYTAYDATWVIGLSLLHAGSERAADLASAIPTVAAGHYGALGNTRLNEAGDLASADYDLWATSGGEWVSRGTYMIATDTVVPPGAEGGA